MTAASTSSTTPRPTAAASPSASWAPPSPSWLEAQEHVVSTKLYFGIDDDAVDLSDTLNRKYLTQAIEGSLERIGLDFVDLLFCHRATPRRR